MTKCCNEWCDNELDEDNGNMCYRCEDLYYDAVIEAQAHDRADKDVDYCEDED